MRLSFPVIVLFLLSSQLAFAKSDNKPFADGVSEAEGTPATWNVHEFTLSFEGYAVKLDSLYEKFKGEFIFTNQPTKKGNVAFMCVTNKLSASVALDPVDFETYIEKNPNMRRGRLKLPYLYIDGKKIKSGPWVYSPEMKTYMPRKPHITNKLYNAAIRGSVVTLSTDYNNPIPLILPKPNAAFADFGAGCGLGRNAK